MSPHLGARVTLLLDGRLSAAETERAWEHVHVCYACRDLVEREGWVKTRLAGLHTGTGSAPAGLKGRLHDPAGVPSTLGPLPSALPVEAPRARRTAGILALSGGAAGAAVVGVLALGAAPAQAPVPDRQARLAQLGGPTGTPAPAPSRERP